MDGYDAKGLAVGLIERVSGQQAAVRLSASKHGHLHPRGASDSWVGEVLLGQLGPLHPDVVDALDLGHTAQIVELDLEALRRVGRGVPQF